MFLLTVDGVHCQIHEPMHPTKSKDSSYYSHKFKRSALNYELGISVYDNALVWLNGPTKASEHDITLFRSQNGLKTMIPEGKRVIADRGYNSKRETAVLSTPNSSDPAALALVDGKQGTYRYLQQLRPTSTVTIFFVVLACH